MGTPGRLRDAGGRGTGDPLGPDRYRSLRLDNTVAGEDIAAFGVDPDDLRTLASYLGVRGGSPSGS